MHKRKIIKTVKNEKIKEMKEEGIKQKDGMMLFSVGCKVELIVWFFMRKFCYNLLKQFKVLFNLF